MSTYRKTPEAVARVRLDYRVTQESGTEARGSGELLDNDEPGIYVDIVSASRCFVLGGSSNRAAAGQASCGHFEQGRGTSSTILRTE